MCVNNIYHYIDAAKIFIASISVLRVKKQQQNVRGYCNANIDASSVRGHAQLKHQPNIKVM